ncbi:MAG: large conductance mechanosensitive channel protein MscL [Planctomycetes bacterium]|nr:large conductance mechanosensitive channel protein MscL [Planctomycetota bacterium]
MVSEFKAFALKGNVVDMAVGVIIGAAFGAVVKSMVSDILMPIVGKATGGVSFKDKFIALDGNTYATLEKANEAGVGTINYGALIDVTITFFIVAFVLFMVIKAMNAAKNKEEAKPAAPAAPPAQEVLLTEIRDLLKKGGAKA